MSRLNKKTKKEKQKSQTQNGIKYGDHFYEAQAMRVKNKCQLRNLGNHQKKEEKKSKRTDEREEKKQRKQDEEKFISVKWIQPVNILSNLSK